MSEEVGAERDDDRRSVRGRRSVHQSVKERATGLVVAAQREQLFELIDNERELRPRRTRGKSLSNRDIQ